MPSRPYAHQLEDRSRVAFKAALPKAWVFRDKTPDYGIDGEIEIFDETGASTGLQALVQLKGKEKSAKLPIVSFDVEWIKYYWSLDLPVLLVVWIEVTNDIYWKWATQVDLYYAKKGAKTLSVSFTQKWTAQTHIEITKALRFKRDLNRRTVALPITIAVTGINYSDVREQLKGLFAYAPRLLAYSDQDPDAACEIRKNEIVISLRGQPGSVLTGMSREKAASRAKSIVLGLTFSLSIHGMFDLAAELWTSIPGIDETIRSFDTAQMAVWMLGRAGATSSLKRLLESLMKVDGIDWAFYPLFSMFSSAPPHRRDELGAVLETVFQSIAKNDDPIVKSTAFYNLARHYESTDRMKALGYFDNAIRSSDFYRRKSYFWAEFGAFLFDNHRYKAACCCYSYAHEDLGESSISNRYADALMHAGRYDSASRVFRDLTQEPIDTSLPSAEIRKIATRGAEAIVKKTALEFAYGELKLASQVRNRRTAVSELVGGNHLINEEMIDCAKRSLQYDALYGDAWFNLGLAYRRIGLYEQALLAYTMAAVCRTPDDESWLNALALAAQINRDLLRPMLDYLRALRGEEFVRYLAEAGRQANNEASRKFVQDLATILSIDLPEPPPSSYRVHGKDRWLTIKIGKGEQAKMG